MESLMLWLMLWKRCHENFYVVVDVVEVVAIVVENAYTGQRHHSRLPENMLFYQNQGSCLGSRCQ